ncbi:uncharacterized protein LOC125864062 [Solanum stenotomum]|uniref:uncharacterized protein LOC125864062 n=1 Tax=Solanum stenotomum TaxID=172797 RepID=UPI0020D18DCF|nr:uncharacterized protein LOC125864062 [Solanum stenotomum]
MFPPKTKYAAYLALKFVNGCDNNLPSAKSNIRFVNYESEIDVENQANTVHLPRLQESGGIPKMRGDGSRTEGHCSDVDEVAYLKWIIACLRYELRNYQSALGETTARDLSKSLSPESSKKAKQLVVAYAAKENQGDRGIHVLELDSNQLSSQEPHLMNSGEFDGTSISNSSAHKSDTLNKSKIFRKLMRLIRGKDHHHNHSKMAHNTEENAARCTYYSSGYCLDMSVVDTGAIRPQSRSRTPSPGSSKQFIEFHSFDQASTTNNKGESRNYPTRTRRYSDVGSLDYMSKHLVESPQEKGNNHDQEDVHKAELAKYAEVLKGSL